MLIVRGRFSSLAKFHCLIIVQILMSVMDQHRRRWSVPILFPLLSACRIVLTMLSFWQVRMSTDIERKVGNLLNSSHSMRAAPSSLPSVSADLGHKKSVTTIKTVSSQQTDSVKEKLSVALKERQELVQVDKHWE